MLEKAIEFVITWFKAGQFFRVKEIIESSIITKE